MISKVTFVASHFVLGVGVFWGVLIQENGVVSVMNAVSIISFVLVSLLNYWIWLCPMNRNRDLQDVGYRHLGPGRQRAAAVNRARRLRSLGPTPPPFPNGWFVLLESRDLSRGQVKQVEALGQNLAVFRGSETGTVFVTEAYCPHLGANIAAGGRVRGDCIQCPFHNWKFSGQTGRCTEVPYSKSTIPEQAKLETKTCLERNGLIMIWHHADSESPTWEPPIIPEVESGAWVYQGRNEFFVNCHVQDIPENGADVAHLDAVHSASIILGGEPTQEQEEKTSCLTSHQWDISWREGEEPHTGVISLHHKKMLMGRFTIFSLGVDALQIGSLY